MFDSKHYMPILKWKSAEMRALRDLSDEDKKYITPLVELVMPKVSSPYKDKEKKIKKSPEEISVEVVFKFKSKRRNEIPEEILNSWGSGPIFVDFSLLHEGQHTARLKVESMNKIVPSCANIGLNLIPVINLNDEGVIKQTVSLLSNKYGTGLCLRITSADLKEIEQLNQKIKDFLKTYGMVENNIDLLVDIKSIYKENSHYLRYVNQSQKVVNLFKWRNLIFASGAFPEDLQECKFGEETFIPRSDWKSWLQYIYNNQLERALTFADYTIRNPIYKESDQFHTPTSSIRYTIENDWMVMKGKKNQPVYYLAHANLLEASGYYSREGFSAGDLFVSKKAKHYPKYMKNPKLKGTGNSADWIYAGINHHLVLTARQVASLS